MGKRKYGRKLPTPEQLPSGKWHVSVMVNGKRHSVTAKTDKECLAKAAALKAEKEQESENLQKITLHDAISEYIDAKENVLSPATIKAYRSVLNTRMQSIMNKDINTITNQQIQRAISSDAKNVSNKTVHNSYSLVHSTLAYFHIHIDDVTLPQVMHNDIDRLQLDEIPKFLEVAKGDSCELPTLMALLMGMRRSEIFGMCWDCIDLEHNTMEIRRSYVQNYKKEWVLKDTTKNSSSQRILQIDPNVLSLLPEPGTGRIITCYPTTWARHVTQICDRAQVTRTTPHGLRHTWASMMRSLGVEESVITRLGGWSTGYTFRMVYNYVFNAEILDAEAKKQQFFAQFSNQNGSE